MAVIGCVAPPPVLGQLGLICHGVESALRAAAVGLVEQNELRRRQESSIETEARATELRERARTLFLAFEFEQALESLELARLLLTERSRDLLGDPTLTRIELDRSRVLQDLGREDEAHRALLHAALTQPGFVPEPNDYPPRLIEAWSTLMSAEASDRGMEIQIDRQRILRLGRTLGIQWIVSMDARVGSEPGQIVLEISVTEVSRGEVVASVSLGIGDPSSRQQQLDEAVSGLIREISPPSEGVAVGPEARAPQITQLLVFSSPEGAALVLDSIALEQATPMTVEVTPGPHRLALTLPGYQRREVDLVAWEGQTRPIEVSLDPVSRRQWFRTWWFWTLVGAVVTGTAAGVTTWGVQASRDQPDVRVEPLR
jgi:hypothetical protein